MAPKITVKTPATDPRIIVESEFGKIELRPCNLDTSGVLMVNAWLVEGNAEVEIYDYRPGQKGSKP